VSRILIRRATTLLLILAILAGPGAGVISMSAAARGMDMAGPLSDSQDGCKGCEPGKMVLADCGTVCISLLAIIQPVAALATGIVHSPRRWHDEPVGRYTTEPPTAPPRSEP
jgi:hypothetical protein